MSALAIDGITTRDGRSRGPGCAPCTPRLRLVTDTPARPIGHPRSARKGHGVPRSRGVAAPSLGAPVRLVAGRRRATVRPAGVQLTDRGMLAVLVVFGVLAVASIVVIVASFFAVSNAPLDGPLGAPPAAAAAAGG